MIVCVIISSDYLGKIIKKTGYLPYGEVAYEWGGFKDSHRFNDREFEKSIGLYYYGARYYNPGLCRFITADPNTPGGGISPQGLNRYSYCLNSPLIYIDPTGNEPASAEKRMQGYAKIAGGIGLMSGGIILGGGTVAETIGTGGVGLWNDPATLGFAGSTVLGGWGIFTQGMSDVFSKSIPTAMPLDIANTLRKKPTQRMITLYHGSLHHYSQIMSNGAQYGFRGEFSFYTTKDIATALGFISRSRRILSYSLIENGLAAADFGIISSNIPDSIYNNLISNNDIIDNSPILGYSGEYEVELRSQTAITAYNTFINIPKSIGLTILSGVKDPEIGYMMRQGLMFMAGGLMGGSTTSGDSSYCNGMGLDAGDYSLQGGGSDFNYYPDWLQDIGGN